MDPHSQLELVVLQFRQVVIAVGQVLRAAAAVLDFAASRRWP